MLIAVLLTCARTTPVYTTKIYCSRFEPLMQVVPTTPEFARQRAVEAPWLSVHEERFLSLVHQDDVSIAGLGAVRLAVRTSSGWIYVDHFGRATGVKSGRFDVIGWYDMLRALKKEELAGPLISVKIANKLDRNVVLADSVGFIQGVIPEGQTRVVKTWYGAHEISYMSRGAVRFPFTADRFEVLPGAATLRIGLKAVPDRRMVEISLEN